MQNRPMMMVRAGVFGALLGGAVPTLAGSVPTACPGGRFPISGALVPGAGSADAIVIRDTQVSIDSGCPAIAAGRKLTRKGTTLVARWDGCGALGGPVVLMVTIDGATCETLTGRFSNRQGKIRRQLTARIDMPAGAFGGPRELLPPDAQVVSQDQWNQLLLRQDFHGIGKGEQDADAAAESRRDAQDNQAVMDFLANDPSLAGQYLGAVDPADPTIAPADGGNFEHTFTDATGASQTVITQGPRWFRRVVAGGLRTFPTQNNQLVLYRNFYEGLQRIDPALVGNYPPPEQASALSLAALTELNVGLASNAGQYLPLLPPPGGTPPRGYPANCGAEEGAGDGSDRTGSSSACATHKALGAYANLPWPLKFFATCVKNQARRGTCWDFATTGSVELWVAKKYGRWVNLSEQHMNFAMKTRWYPAAYGDGEWPGHALGAMLVSNLLPDPWRPYPAYSYPFEDQWDYNPSSSRTANDMTQTYASSCTGYGGDESAFCSNSAAQGQVFCTTILSITYCGMIGPAATPTSGFYPTAYSELWNAANPSGSLGTIFWAVGIFQKPVIYSFSVPPSFTPDANGYIHYVGAHCPVTTDSKGKSVCMSGPGCECDGGGHAVLVTGLVDNSQLPSGAPPGSGGGYVVIKNSWGLCYGDAGYAYVPYDWVKAYALAAEVVGDIN